MKRDELVAKMRPILIGRREALRRRLSGELTDLNANWDRDEVGDDGDTAAGTQDDEIHSVLAQSDSQEIHRINAALESMDRGDYGVCEECHQPIASARLMALPYITTCINCQRNAESHRSRTSLDMDYSSADDVEENSVD